MMSSLDPCNLVVNFCTFMTPHLLLPRFLDTNAMPALALLAARGRQRTISRECADAWLCRAFGLSAQATAPVALLGEGGEPGEAIWLHADPVHFLMQRQGLIVLEASQFQLTREETGALLADLNHHFAADGFHFEAPVPSRWYLRSPGPAPATRPLHEVAGRLAPPSPFLEGAPGEWHRLLSEIQMLLHAHPVNQAREERGEAPINGLWLWGGGVLPAQASSPFDRVYAESPLARGCAKLSGQEPSPLPERFGDLTAQTPLLVLDNTASDLETAWFAPLLAALKAGRIGGLHLYLPERGLHIETRRHDLWKFWRSHSLPPANET